MTVADYTPLHLVAFYSTLAALGFGTGMFWKAIKATMHNSTNG